MLLGDAGDSGTNNPASDAPPVSGEGASDSFTTRFNPSELPDELRAGYQQMQGDYTRKTQELADLRKEAENAVAFVNALNDENTRALALRQLAEQFGPDYVTAAGYQFDEEDDSSQGNPQQDFRDPRVDELLSRFEQQEQAAQEAQLIAEISTFAESEFDRLGIKSEAEREIVLARAAGFDLDNHGMPQIERAAQEYEAAVQARQQAWIESKKNTPRVPLAGRAGSEKLDLNDPEVRQQVMADLMEANSN